MFLSKSGLNIEFNKENKELVEYQRQLTVKPIIESTYKTYNKPIQVFRKSATHLIVPQFFIPLNETLRKTKWYMGEHWNHPITFKGTLRDYQQDIVDKAIEQGHGVIHMKTGMGKTFCALAVIEKLKGKTLIVVNKVSLLTQWKHEIDKFLLGSIVCIIQGRNTKIDPNADIYIGMLQSLAFIPELLDTSWTSKLKVVVVDEVHNICTMKFSNILFRIASPHMYGLSATPQRADGLSKIIHWHLGPLIKNTFELKMKVPMIIRWDSGIQLEEIRNAQNTIQFAEMLSELFKCHERNVQIVQMIRVLTEQQRSILVLTERREHVRILSEMCQNIQHGIFIGGMKEKDIEHSKQMNLIIGTIQAVGEGVNIEHLNTLILATPKKYIKEHQHERKRTDSGKLEQAIGRIFRKDTGKVPMIIDIVDSYSIFLNQARQRVHFYKKQFKDVMIENVKDMDFNKLR